MRRLRFYHRDGCHLCEQMLMQLERLQRDRDFSLECIDVAHDGAVAAAYQSRIPVLEDLQGECLAEHFLDPERRLSYLDGA